MKDRRSFQRIFFFGMLTILAILALALVWQFVRAILLAIALVIILKPIYNWLLNKKGINGKESRATAITILIFILIIAIPAIFIIGGALTQAAVIFSGLNLDGATFNIREINVWLENTIQTIIAGNTLLDTFAFAENLTVAVAWFTDWFVNILIGLGQSLPMLFTNSLVVLVILYVALSRYKSPGKQEILEVVPFPKEITQLFLDKIDLMIKAMFKGTFLIAMAQGLSMGVVFWLAGVPYVMFLTIISMFLSLVPLIGISLVAWPVGILLILSGNIFRGVFVIAAFLIFVAQIDTILRPRLVPKDAQLNPALVILSVLGGLGLLGLVGALYGPVVMILLVTSIDVYSKYILRSDLETLEKEGRIDLVELGLKSGDSQAEENLGQMALTALKNISARLRREAPPVEPASEPDTVNP